MIIDNLIQSFALNMEQGIPIRPFINDEFDMELKYYADVLEKGGNVQDVRLFLKDNLSLFSFYEYLK